jgi:UDP-GlcNAc:undecaprenyl-phosphate GlcNAc-1-phosphate transferase
MYSLLGLGVVAFLLSLSLTPLIRDLFNRWGVVDRPDEVRKLHGRGIPRIGGIPLAMAYVGALVLFALMPVSARQIVRHDVPLVMRLLPTGLAIFVVGLIDDLFGLRAWQKLAGQIAASLLALLAGIRLASIGGHALPVWISGPATILWLVGCANALNLIDGLDGLATGVGLFATVTTLASALLNHNFELAIATAPLVGALLGFLRYNFNPASIFLGDSGSLLIGFLLGCYAIVWSEKSATLLGMTAPLIALSIPLLDVTLAIVRRFLRQQPLFSADRGHIHHKLLARGLTPRRVALLLYGLCGITAALSLLQSVANEQFAGLIIVLFCIGAWIGVQHLRYVELGAAGRMVMGGGFRRVLKARIALDSFAEAVQQATDVAACWEIIRSSHRHFGFTHVEFNVDGICRRDVSSETHDACVWSVTIPLTDDDYIRLYRNQSTEVDPALAATYIDSIRKAVLSRLIPKSVAAVS